ncbi:MAG: HAD-IA family hydrolase [Proteobacteria bacterium]|nr:HAD-IA family hydrolase [Pseudomonadota bacterium]
MRYGALTFDLDGTLVATAAEIAVAVNRTLAGSGLPTQSEADIARHVGAGLHATLDGVLTDLSAELPRAPLYARLDVHYAVVAGRSARPYRGAAEMLAALRSEGVRLACVTNKAHRFAQQVLDGTGLAPLLDYVIGGDSLPYKKPDARVLTHALHVLGATPARAAHVGDSLTDTAAARNAGVAAWAVPWGYRGNHTLAELNAERVFDAFDDLTTFVQAANAAA